MTLYVQIYAEGMLTWANIRHYAPEIVDSTASQREKRGAIPMQHDLISTSTVTIGASEAWPTCSIIARSSSSHLR